MSGISSGVGSGSSAQVSFLQQQVNRLDPANKCLSFNSWTSKSTSGRKALIESYVEGICPGTSILSIEHVWTGPPGKREIGPISFVEFSSRSVRESILKYVQQAAPLKEDDKNTIGIQRAKIAWQLKRNSSLKKAEEILKKDARAKGQTCKIDWQVEESKTRTVSVGDVVAFSQDIGDQTGCFVEAFANCSF